ncbi:hypothetical protein [Stappia sp.]|uniref:hypothetical protein n=1 Tax=Stappia sp. TaxID=1870903 RepID=UPI0032D8C311
MVDQEKKTPLPNLNGVGERSRLFPVLAETSKEGRALSILLACVANVRELGQSLLSDLGVRVGVRAEVETFTEVVFEKTGSDKSLRPDGLILVRNGSRQWPAIVEAKIGNSELSQEQIENYLDIAKQNKIDAVITISNQFAPLPSHHPVQLGAISRRKSELYHWSWMHILTESKILLDNDNVADEDQRLILNELVRFLAHDSTGVKHFSQMPSEWTTVLSTVQAGGGLSQTSADVKAVVGAWHQEGRDLSLTLSRQIGRNVKIRVPRAQRADPTARLKADCKDLCSDNCLRLSLSVPDAASPIEVVADLKTKSIAAVMRLKAPADRKTTKARINWLLRQLKKAESTELHVRLYWPGRGPFSQSTLEELRRNPDLVLENNNKSNVTSFEVLLVRDCGPRFSQRKNFIVDLETVVPSFYLEAGQYLREWQAPAPRIREEKSGPKDVDTEALQEEAEREAGDFYEN